MHKYDLSVIIPSVNSYDEFKGACGLSPLMFFRTVKTVWGKGVHKDHLIKSIPVLVRFCIAWGAVKAVGHAFRGQSDERSALGVREIQI